MNRSFPWGWARSGNEASVRQIRIFIEPICRVFILSRRSGIFGSPPGLLERFVLHGECHLEPQPHVHDRTRWPVDQLTFRHRIGRRRGCRCGPFGVGPLPHRACRSPHRPRSCTGGRAGRHWKVYPRCQPSDTRSLDSAPGPTSVHAKPLKSRRFPASCSERQDLGQKHARTNCQMRSAARKQI